MEPFNAVEDVSKILGIPLDASSEAASKASRSIEHVKIDPRSPEFKNILIKISDAFKSLNENKHNRFKDHDKYQRWLEQLYQRATSLIARSMRELLESTGATCVEMYHTNNKLKKKNLAQDQPLESSPIYQKFRGLGFRLRELSALLTSDDRSGITRVAGQVSGAIAWEPSYSSQRFFSKNQGYGRQSYSYSGTEDEDDITDDSQYHHHHQQQGVLEEVKQGYVILRNSLLAPVVRDALAALITSSTNTTSTNTSSGSGQGQVVSLCPYVRQAFSLLLTLAQMELQLFDSLFSTPRDNSSSSSSSTDELSSDTGRDNQRHTQGHRHSHVAISETENDDSISGSSSAAFMSNHRRFQAIRPSDSESPEVKLK
jgi:hypothetical protein